MLTAPTSPAPHLYTARQGREITALTSNQSDSSWAWKRWWRKQSPHRQDRFAILAPLLAVVLFSLAILVTLTYLRLDENEREREAVQRDVEVVQQRMRMRLIEGRDAVIGLSREMAGAHGNVSFFVERAEALIDKHPEIIAMSLVDSQQRVKAAFTAASMFGPSSYSRGNRLKEIESTKAFVEATSTGQPVWSRPGPAPSGVMEVYLPFYTKGRLGGVILAEYSVDSLLIHTVPPDMNVKYAMAVVSPQGELVAGRLMPNRPLSVSWLPWLDRDRSHATPVAPMTDALVLRAQAYRTSLSFVGSGMIWLVGVLSVFTIWMLMGTWRHTRKRLEAQQALLKETNFRRAMENSMLTGMRVMDNKGRITYVNPAFCQMTGWSESELVGQTAPFSYWPYEDTDMLNKLLADELAGVTQPSGAQIRVKRKNRTVFDARMYVSPLIDPSGVQTGWMTSMTDITEPNRIREQLSASQERFTTVLEGLDAAVSVAPLGSDELLFANAQYRHWFGAKGEDHTHLAAQAGVTPIESSDQSDPIDHLAGFPTDQITTATVSQAEIFVPELDKWMEVRCRYLTWVDGRLAQMVIATDISARRHAEEQAVNQAEKAQAASRLITMGEMASSVAHELNQPLTAISNYCNGLLTRIKDNKLDNASLLVALEKTVHQAQRAGQIIQRIRAFVQRSEPNRSPADVATMVAEAVELAQIEFRRRRVRLRHFVAANLPPVEVDPILIEQVMVNLLKNAAEAIDLAGQPPAKRSVELRVRQRLIENKEMIEVCVNDTGKGLPPQALKRLYEAFFSTKAEGMGMGLNLCRSIIESHQGRIEAQNLYNGDEVVGCQFVFWLPIDPEHGLSATTTKAILPVTALTTQP
jgi:PAS domain S-box-containing protein